MRRGVATTVFFIAAIALIPSLWPILRVHILENSFSKLKINDSRDAVVRMMGHPWKQEDCGKWLGGTGAGCTEEFVYAHPYAPYIPEYWIISFNSDHKVINVYHAVSP